MLCHQYMKNQMLECLHNILSFGEMCNFYDQNDEEQIITKCKFDCINK